MIVQVYSEVVEEWVELEIFNSGVNQFLRGKLTRYELTELLKVLGVESDLAERKEIQERIDEILQELGMTIEKAMEEL